MKICFAGEGAISRKHLKAIARIDSVEIASLVGGDAADTKELAAAHHIPHWTLDLAEGLAQPDVTAAILATPTPLHASQAEQVMRLSVCAPCYPEISLGESSFAENYVGLPYGWL